MADIDMDTTTACHPTHSLQQRDPPTHSSIPPDETYTFITDSVDDIDFSDPMFGLSSDSAYFLDQVFMQETDWELLDLNDQPSVSETPDTRNISRQTMDGLPKDPVMEPMNAGQLQSLLEVAGVDPNVFDGALHAYFDKAAPSLPVVFEDAFWLDYGARRCSLALVSAIACRGMPFTGVENKWQLQQQLGREFRKALLEAQQTASSQSSIRLDELEALALMVNFEFEDDHSSGLESRLGNLFLTHESLVLMTLELRDDSRALSTQALGSSLARAQERRTLLFWHVYGLDAFHCLDRSCISRIQDDHVELVEQRPSNQFEGYLDAILALALIARKTAQTLCSSKAKRKGVKLHEIQCLFDHLHRWHDEAGLSCLQLQGSDCSQPKAKAKCRKSSSAQSTHGTQLQQAVLRFLELNCYMQIESIVAQNGTKQDALEGEILDLRVAHETLRAISDVVGAFDWETMVERQNRQSDLHSLFDLAPQLLRDICAGVCTWMCLRGRALQHGSQDATVCADRRKLASYAKVARKMRSAVASATSHRDTEEVVARLDDQLGLFKDLVDPAQPCLA